MMKRFLLNLMLATFVTTVMMAQSLNDTLELGEVVVTGSRVEVSRKNLPLNVTVINNEMIDEIEESAVLPMISRRVPSVFVSERGVTGFGRTGSTSAGNISIRGVGGSPNTQVLVLLDGHPQYMGIFGHPIPNSYVASDLEKVEIIRGPASILYGSNAMGGVMNFITKEQKKDGISGSARLAYGSFNTQKYMANAGYKRGKFDVFASFNHDQTDGHRDSSDFNINNGYLKAGYAINSHLKVSADFNLAESQSIDPGMVDVASSPFTADMTRGKTSFSITNKYDKLEGGLIGFYNYGDHAFSDNWESHDENYGLSVYQGIKAFSGNLLTLGFDYKRLGGIGNAAFPPVNANKWFNNTEFGGYLVFRQSLNEILDLSAGIRLEENSHFGSEWIPQFGLAWHISPTVNLKASVSEGFRSPTITELYLFAPNLELKPEHLMSYETSVEASMLKGKINSVFTVYYLNGSNLIMRMPNPNAPPPMKNFNSGEFEHKGFELETSWNALSNLNIDISYSYLDMDKPKLAAPKHQAFLGARYAISDFTLSLQSSFVGSLLVFDGATDDADIYEDYLLLNASVKYAAADWLEVFLSGKNLLDAEYMIDQGYPMPGINIMLGIGFKF